MRRYVICAVVGCALSIPVIGMEDGVYLQSTNAALPALTTQDGKPVHIGQKYDLHVQDAHVFAQDNANSSFCVSLNVPYDPKLDDTSATVLVVKDTAYRQNGAGSSQRKTSSLNYLVAGRDKVEGVAGYFGIAPRFRQHPQHCFLTRFVPAKEEFEPGEEVWVTLRVENVGTNTVAFMKGGRNRAARDNQYAFAAYQNGKQIRDVGTTHHFGGIACVQKIAPGGVFEDKVNLSKWFAFDEPGIYAVTGSYYMSFVNPAESSFQTVWEDYVAGEFWVRIKGTPRAKQAPADTKVPVASP